MGTPAKCIRNNKGVAVYIWESSVFFRVRSGTYDAGSDGVR